MVHSLTGYIHGILNKETMLHYESGAKVSITKLQNKIARTTKMKARSKNSKRALEREGKSTGTIISFFLFHYGKMDHKRDYLYLRLRQRVRV